MKYTLIYKFVSSDGKLKTVKRTWTDKKGPPAADKFIMSDLSCSTASLIAPYSSVSNFLECYVKDKIKDITEFSKYTIIEYFEHGLESIESEVIGGNWKFVVFNKEANRKFQASSTQTNVKLDCIWTNGIEDQQPQEAKINGVMYK